MKLYMPQWGRVLIQGGVAVAPTGRCANCGKPCDDHTAGRCPK